MRQKTVLKVAFAVASLLLILRLVDVPRFLQSVAGLEPLVALAALAATVPVVVFRVTRWQLILRASEVRLGSAEVFRISLIGLFFSIITPSKLGDLGKSYYLHRTGVSSGRSFSLALLDRVFDLLIIFIISGLGFFAIISQAVFLPVFAVLFILAFAALFNERVFCTVAGALLRRLRFLNKYTGDDISAVQEVYFPFRQLRRRPATLAATCLLSLASWASSALIAFLFLQALGSPIPFLHALLVVSLAGTVGLLPITIAGLGLREGAFVSLLALSGVAAETALAASLLYFAAGSLIPAAAGYLLYVWGKPADTKKLL